jgi:dTDP-4-dehydrorhamnose 3,5-epimerase-like enzyme
VAHGFCVTSDHAALAYLLSSPFNAAFELEIHPFDPEVNVPWSLDAEPTLSAKDAAAPSLNERRVANQLPSFHP